MKYTDSDDYCKDRKDSAEFKEIDKVTIGYPKPCITTLLEGHVKVEIKNTKVVKNCDGFKLIVEGCKYIKIEYCSNDLCACGKKFTDTFVVPFKEVLTFCGCYRKLKCVDAYVEKCAMKKLSPKSVLVKTVIRIEADFEHPVHEDWDHDWDCNCKVECDCYDK